jgi:hypothetical protein
VGQQGGGSVVKRVAGVDDAAAGLTIGAVLSWCLSGAAISVLIDQIIQMGGWVADRLSTGSWNIRQNWCRTIFSALFGCVFGMVGGPAARIIFGEVAAFSLAQLGRWVYQKLLIWGFTFLAGRWGAMIAMSGCAESEEPAPITPPN